jgi:hypothetical protein
MITRRQALLGAAAGIAARPAAAFAADTDRGPLTALVAYQQAVAAAYDGALRKAPFGNRDRATLERFRRDAEQAAAALRKALQDDGGTAPAPTTAPAPVDTSRRGYLRELIAYEEAAVASYYAGLQALGDKRHLDGSAAFMAQAGRHLVVLRKLAGEPLLPRAFETGAT